VDFLCQQSVQFEQGEMAIIFELFEDQDNYNTIINRLNPDYVTRNPPQAVYTHDEINASQWLRVYSNWNSLYPQPERNWGYIFKTYDATNYCEGNPNLFDEEREEYYRKYDMPIYHCRKGLIQRKNFILKKAPNWGARNFTMLHWVSDELFISPKAEEVLRNSDLTGFDYYTVNNKSNKPFDNVKQLFINNYADKGFCADAIERTYTCPICGFTKYHPKAGHIRFHKEIFEGNKNDIVKTTDKFWPIACASLILITHKFYKTITEAKLDRGLIFEPVELV